MECGDQDDAESTGELYQLPDGRVRVATAQRQPHTREAWYWQLPRPGVREPDHFLRQHFPACLTRPAFAPAPPDLVVQVLAPGLGRGGGHASPLGHTTYVAIHLAVLRACGTGTLLHLYNTLGPPECIECWGIWQVVRTVRQPELSFSALCSLLEWVYSSSEVASLHPEAPHCCICCVPDLLSVRQLATATIPALQELAELLALPPLDAIAAANQPPSFHGFELSIQQAAMMWTFFFEVLDEPVRDSAGGLAFMRPGLHVVCRGPLLVANVAGHVVPRLRSVDSGAVVDVGRARSKGCYALLIPATHNLVILLDYLHWCRNLTVRARVMARQLRPADGDSILKEPPGSHWVRLCLRVPAHHAKNVMLLMPLDVKTPSSNTHVDFMPEGSVIWTLQTLRQLDHVDMHLRGYLALPLKLRVLDVLFSRLGLSFAFVNFSSRYSLIVEGDVPSLIDILDSFRLSFLHDPTPNESIMMLPDVRTGIRLVEVAMDDYPSNY